MVRLHTVHLRIPVRSIPVRRTLRRPLIRRGPADTNSPALTTPLRRRLQATERRRAIRLRRRIQVRRLRRCRRAKRRRGMNHRRPRFRRRFRRPAGGESTKRIRSGARCRRSRSCRRRKRRGRVLANAPRPPVDRRTRGVRGENRLPMPARRRRRHQPLRRHRRVHLDPRNARLSAPPSERPRKRRVGRLAALRYRPSARRRPRSLIKRWKRSSGGSGALGSGAMSRWCSCSSG